MGQCSKLSNKSEFRGGSLSRAMPGKLLMATDNDICCRNSFQQPPFVSGLHMIFHPHNGNGNLNYQSIPTHSSKFYFQNSLHSSLSGTRVTVGEISRTNQALLCPHLLSNKISQHSLKNSGGTLLMCNEQYVQVETALD